MTTKVRDWEAMEVGCINSHFLDSGSFSLWTKAAEYAKEHKCLNKYAYYDTPEFWAYADAYVEFVKAYSIGIDLYANIDVIPDPVLSYRNLKYLESKGLKPVPVIHYTTDLKWLRKHIDEGYEMIGLGGLVGSIKEDGCIGWIDRCFDTVCDNPSRLPTIKLHGFGVTSYDMMIRYPWWSVDSTSWTKAGAFGGIYVPHQRQGKWVFDEQPYLMKVSDESPDRKKQGTHYLTMSPMEQKIIREWLEYLGVPLGKLDDKGETLEFGVITRHTERRAANLLFFEEMRKSLPDWPWPFVSKRKKGLGLMP